VNLRFREPAVFPANRRIWRSGWSGLVVTTIQQKSPLVSRTEGSAVPPWLTAMVQNCRPLCRCNGRTRTGLLVFQPADSPATFDGSCPAGLAAGGPASLRRDAHLLLRVGVVHGKVVGNIVRGMNHAVKQARGGAKDPAICQKPGNRRTPAAWPALFYRARSRPENSTPGFSEPPP